MSAPELVERLAADRNITASAQTVRDDCNALVEQGDLLKDGRKWLVVSQSIPEPAAIYTNGHSAH